MTNKQNEQAILLLHTLRTEYICDPNECKFTKGDENCILCECDNYHDALAFAIECIEKQIPKKPKIENYKYPYGYTDVRDNEYDLVCPCCREYLVEDDHHCKCGQAIDWNEVE